MRIKIVRPDPDYPLVWVHIPIETDVDGDGVAKALKHWGLSRLGRWEVHIVKGTIESLKAPALLENEYVKPRKRR